MLAILPLVLAFSYRPIVAGTSSAAITSLNVHKLHPEAPEPKNTPPPMSCGMHNGCAGCTCGKNKAQASRLATSRVVMSAVVEEDVAAIAQATACAAAVAAEQFAVNGGNGGDKFGSEGIAPVIEAASAACSDCPAVSGPLLEAANAAAQRTNANAARVADAIVVAAKALGAKESVSREHPITGNALYGTLKDLTAAKWQP